MGSLLLIFFFYYIKEIYISSFCCCTGLTKKYQISNDRRVISRQEVSKNSKEEQMNVRLSKKKKGHCCQFCSTMFTKEYLRPHNEPQESWLRSVNNNDNKKRSLFFYTHLKGNGHGSHIIRSVFFVIFFFVIDTMTTGVGRLRPE